MPNNQKDPIDNHPEIIAKIQAVIYEDDGIRVGGFSSHLQEALRQVDLIHRAVVRFFVDKAIAGELDDDYKIIEKKIISLDKRIVQ